MPSSPKLHHHGRPSPPSPRRSTMLIVSCCLVVGFSGFILGFVAILGPSRGCSGVEPRLIRVSWDRGGRDGGDGGFSVRDGEKVLRRHKVKAFVGIQTGFGSVGRRRSLRRTWMPSDREKLQRLEEDTGLVFRFVIGRTNDGAKMMELKKEVSQYDDFLLLDVEEEYSRLPYKTLAFFKAAYALFDAEFYVKADDDIYLRPDRLSLLLTKERSHSQTYIGCMKKGPVFTDPKRKWYEPLGFLLGKEYFFHAYGPIYALSAEVVASLVALRSNRIDTRETLGVKDCVLVVATADGILLLSVRMFSNEDVTIGAWMLAMNVHHENNKELCQPECTPSSIAVWDIPKCSGLCSPEKKLLELHQKEICSDSPTVASDG